MEYAISHIPGALNVAPQPGRPPTSTSPTSPRSGVFSEERRRRLSSLLQRSLLREDEAARGRASGRGVHNVRRYQLGRPGWRTLAGGAMQTELAALRYIARDKTAVWIDAREPAAFKAGTIPGARNIQRAAFVRQGPGGDEGGQGRWPAAHG